MQISDTKSGDIIAVTLHGSEKRIAWIVSKPTDTSAVAMPLQDIEITLDLTDQPKLIQLYGEYTMEIVHLGFSPPPSTFIPEQLPEYLL